MVTCVPVNLILINDKNQRNERDKVDLRTCMILIEFKGMTSKGIAAYISL